MGSKCVYCGTDIQDSRSMEICDKCGVQVWGQKMFEAIKKSTDDARSRGDLCHDNTFTENPKVTNEFQSQFF